MANKQGQQNRTGNQEGQGKQGFQEETKKANQANQQNQGGKAAQQFGGQKPGPQPGSGKDKRGKIGQ